MAAAQQANKLPVIGPLDLNKVERDFNAWKSTQPVWVEVAIATLTSGLQGGVMGYAFSFLLKDLSSAPAGQAGASAGLAQSLQALQTGGPWVQARSLAILTGANQGINLAMKKYRKGKDDVWNSVAASFGAGVLYSLSSGAKFDLGGAFATGLTFAAFNGLIYQIGGMFKPAPETDYEHAKGLLTHLGLTKYYDNLKRQLLTDNTIMLWNESALSSANIPAGPRLLILHHLDAIRNPAHARSGYLAPPPAYNSLLKPALPLPAPQSQQMGGR